MNLKVLVTVAAIIGVIEFVLISNPELWDDMMYQIGKIPEWFQERNLWLNKPKQAGL